MLIEIVIFALGIGVGIYMGNPTVRTWVNGKVKQAIAGQQKPAKKSRKAKA